MMPDYYTSATVGDFAVVYSPEEAAEVAKESPDLPRYSPQELTLIGEAALASPTEETKQGLLKVAVVKRVLPGSVLRRIDRGGGEGR